MNAPINNISEIAAALSYVSAQERGTWVGMGMAVKAELGEDGFTLWDSWSQTASNYNAKAANSVWKGIKAAGGVTIATLFHEAKAHGWKPTTPYTPPTPEERARIDAEHHTAEAEAERIKEEMRAQAKTKAVRLWEKARLVREDHPYIVAKGIKPYGAKQLWDMLVMPLRCNGELVNLQIIGKNGSKTFLSGGQVKGTSLVLGTLKGAEKALPCEGWATGCTLHEATDLPVVVCWNAGNLPDVAKRLASAYPELPLQICGDNDASGKGQEAAQRAAEHSKATWCVPSFSDEQQERFQKTHGKVPSDFNDLHQLEGLEAVLNVLQQQGANDNNQVKPSDSLACDYGGGRFEVSSHGAVFIGTDKDGNELPPRWICSPLYVVAMTRDAKSGEWGRLLEWRDNDNVRHQWAMPLELLQGDGADVRRELARLGLSIAPGKAARDLLASYLQVWPVEARARCVDRLGWHGAVYVTPAESVGQNHEIVVFQNAHALEPAFAISGTAEAWRSSVAALAAGNSRLVFALSVALAGPLADVVCEDSGGFHFRGSSSSGKSTALKVAASVWGDPSAYPRLWRATSNGLEGLAALHNDGLLILDELSQIDPKEAGEAAYLLANGQGKARASRAGTVRQSARWRLLFLSAGEESLSALMARAGRKANAGQEIRLADIDADAGAGMGAFEVLHDQPSPAALAVAMKDAATRYYGAVGLAWLRRIVSDRPMLADLITGGIRQFVEETAPPNAAGQVLRVARRFALVAVAGELSTYYGLTGWKEGEAIQAAQKCFSVWLESFGGTGNREERAMLSQVRAFFETHGASRFEYVAANNDQRILNRAGFYRIDESGAREFMVLPEAFKRDVCQGFDAKAVTVALLKAGWLQPGRDGKTTQKPRLPGIGPTRCYVFTGRMWEAE